jgi:hypothetical protein
MWRYILVSQNLLFQNGVNILHHYATAPVDSHEADVGSRTTFDFINQQHTKTLVPGVHSGGKEPNSKHGGKRDSTVVVFESHSPFARYHLYAPLLKKAAAARGAARDAGSGGSSSNSSSGAGAGAAAAGAGSVNSDIMILSPELVAHAFKMWGQLTAAVEVGSDVAGFKGKSFMHKPMTGWFGFVYALQVGLDTTFHNILFCTSQNTNDDSRYVFHVTNRVTPGSGGPRCRCATTCTCTA